MDYKLIDVRLTQNKVQNEIEVGAEDLSSQVAEALEELQDSNDEEADRLQAYSEQLMDFRAKLVAV